MDFDGNAAGLLRVDNIAYYVTQVNGQRLLKLRDEHLRPRPPKGSEIFVGKLPRHIGEQELVRLFTQVGAIYKLRLMVDFNGRNRGYAFITYFEQEVAQEAILRYHQYEVYSGCRIGVYKSVDNCRLFVGNLPRAITKPEIYREIAPYAEGLKNVILYKSMEDPRLNRGFAFLEFEDHRSAAMTRRKLAPGTFFVWNTSILVDWADPLPEVDPKVMATVKKLYMRNLSTTMTNEDLKILLVSILRTYAQKIVKVYKTQDYAFLHFETRSAADASLKLLSENAAMFGEEIEVTWARPKIYSKQCRGNAYTDTFCTSLPPQNRRIVQMRQQCAKRRIECNPQELMQCLQHNSRAGGGVDRNNNLTQAPDLQRDHAELQTLTLRSNL